MSFDLGLATHRFIGQPLGASGTLAEGANTFRFRFGTEPGQNLVTNTIALQLRVALFLSGPLYVASDVELGGVVSGPRSWGAIDGSEAGPISPTYAATHGAVGLRAKLEPFAISGEAAGGFRLLEYKIPDETATAYQTRAELQIRARIDVWLSPRVTIGAMLGSSVIDRVDRIVAVSVGGHLRAFGGE